MFYSGVKNSCPLEVFHNNCGQNGPVLGMGCSLFLARFLANLAYIYDDMAKAENYKDDEFIPHVYKDALLKCLRAYSKEDSEEHGRLKELQRMLCDIDDRIGDFGSEDEEQ